MLLSQIAEGDEKAFGTLVRHYHSNIYSVAYKLTRHEALSEEVVQDVFVKIWLKRTMLPALEVFPAYLFKIAEYTIFSAMRKLYRDKALHGKFQETAHMQADESDLMLEKELEGMLQKAVERLPGKQRLAYELVKVQGLKREAAARQLGVSPETVKSNLDQAMRNIRAYCIAQSELHLVLLLLASRNLM